MNIENISLVINGILIAVSYFFYKSSEFSEKSYMEQLKKEH